MGRQAQPGYSTLDRLLCDVSGKFTPRDDLLAAILAERDPVGIGDRVRFDHRTKQWLVWDGIRWAPDLTTVVYDVVREKVNEWMASDGFTGEDKKYAVTLYDMNKKKRVLESLAAMENIRMDGSEWDQNGDLLVAANGVVDLATGKRRDGRPEDLMSKSTKVVYDPERYPHSERFERFLWEVYVTPEMVAYMKRAIGALLVGGRLKSFLLLLGETDTGKSVLIGTLDALLGEYAVMLGLKAIARPSRQGDSNAHTRELMRLPGSRFAYVVETDEDTVLHVARLKGMTGDDSIPLAGPYSRREEEHPVTWKVWLATNEPPKVKDGSDATWQRMQSIPHTVRFWKPEEAHPEGARLQEAGLDDRLKAGDELSSILTMAVGWAGEFIADGRRLLPLPAEGVAKRDALRLDDELSVWIDLDMHEEPGASIGAQEAFDRYETWCFRSHVDAVSITKFGTLMGKRYKSSKAGGGAKRYLGIRLATAAEMAG